MTERKSDENLKFQIVTLGLPRLPSQVYLFMLGDLHEATPIQLLVLRAFFGKKILSDSKKKEKKVINSVLRTKVVLKFSVRLQKKKKKSLKNILCKWDSINYRKLSLL